MSSGVSSRLSLRLCACNSLKGKSIGSVGRTANFLKIVLVLDLVVVLVLDLVAAGFPAPPAVSMPTTSATRTRMIIPGSREAQSPSNAEVSKQRLKEADGRLARRWVEQKRRARRPSHSYVSHPDTPLPRHPDTSLPAQTPKSLSMPVNSWCRSLSWESRSITRSWVR
jgi:hypothetical protein